MNGQFYVLWGEVVNVSRYDSDTESIIRSSVQCCQRTKDEGCMQCWFHDGGDCNRIACAEAERPDGRAVYFKSLKNN